MISIKFVEILLKFKNYSIYGFEKIRQTLKRVFYLIFKNPEVGLKKHAYGCASFFQLISDSVFGNG